MKKIVLSILLLTIFLNCFATIYYVRTNGSNSNNGLTNTSGGAWLTVRFACQNTTSGDVINIATGTYLETAAMDLNPGVSIIGADSSNTIIQSTVTGNFTYVLGLLSAEGTNGNQSISNIKFDGRGLTNFWAIPINGRSNVEVHHCTFIDYIDAAVLMRGKEGSGAGDGAPTAFATGNKFHDNRVINCSRYTSFGTGALWIGGQDGLLIYNNYMTATQRGAGANGWCIKNQLNGGYIKGVKIYNNQFYRDPLHGGTFDFIIESFFELGGIEIYNNAFHGGGLDMNYQNKTTYPYSIWIHNNTWDYQIFPVTEYQSCITLEYNTENAIIENNTADGACAFVLFTQRPGTYTRDILIYKNLSTRMGLSGGGGMAIQWETSSETTGDSYSRDIKINHNTFVSTSALYGVRVPDANGSAGNFMRTDSFAITNNIFQNFATAAIVANPAANVDSIFTRNNIFYLNGNSNNPVYNSGTPTNQFTTGNIYGTNPNLNASYIPNVGSVAINGGTDGLNIGHTATGGGGANTPPVSRLIINRSIQAPATTITLDATATDPDGTISTVLWQQVSGASATIVSPGALTTNITGITTKSVFRLTVTDNGGATDVDEITVSVIPVAVTPTKRKRFYFSRGALYYY